MPYIEAEHRSLLEPHVIKRAQEPGDLNYQITKLCDEYLRRYQVSYSSINAVIGVLECAKLELYRRVASVYEDSKLAQNGDVYGR